MAKMKKHVKHEEVYPSRFHKGMLVQDIESGEIYKITGGYYLDPYNHRVSNFFYMRNLRTGEESNGYGHIMYRVTTIRETITVIDADGIERTFDLKS